MWYDAPRITISNYTMKKVILGAFIGAVLFGAGSVLAGGVVKSDLTWGIVSGDIIKQTAYVQRLEDKDHGVVCYVAFYTTQTAYSDTGPSTSCVKVR